MLSLRNKRKVNSSQQHFGRRRAKIYARPNDKPAREAESAPSSRCQAADKDIRRPPDGSKMIEADWTLKFSLELGQLRFGADQIARLGRMSAADQSGQPAS